MREVRVLHDALEHRRHDEAVRDALASAPPSATAPGRTAAGSTSVRPPQMDDMIGVTPATWKIGTESSVTSGSSLGSAGLIVFVTYTERFRYVSATPFGTRRRAGGVDQHRRLGSRRPRRTARRRCAARGSRGRCAMPSTGFVDSRRSARTLVERRPQRRDEVEVALADEQHVHVRRVDHVRQLFVLRAVVQRHERRADLRRGVVRLDVLDAVRRHRADRVVRARRRRSAASSPAGSRGRPSPRT